MYIWELENWPKFIWNIEELTPRLAAVHQQQGQLLGQSGDLPEELDLQAQMDALIQNAIRTMSNRYGLLLHDS